MKKQRVVGMTITGASIYNKWIRELQPDVIIVEEAAEVLEAMVPADARPRGSTAMKVACDCRADLADAPFLGEADSDVEEDPEDVAEPEEEDPERDALEERAAGIVADAVNLPRPPAPETDGGGTAALCYAPLHFQVIRHLFRGTRH